MLGLTKTELPIKLLRIKLMQSIAGHRTIKGQAFPFSYGPFAVIDWPADEAERYIERGIARRVPPETELGVSPMGDI